MITSHPHAVSGSRRHQNSPSFENIDLAVNAPRDLVTGKQTDAMLNRMCVYSKIAAHGATATAQGVLKLKPSPELVPTQRPRVRDMHLSEAHTNMPIAAAKRTC